MPKRSNRLPLLAILCLALAILCVAAILIWLNFGRANGEGEQQNLGAVDSPKKEEEAKTTTMAMANTTNNKLTTTMATETTNKIEKEEEELFEASTSAWTFAEIGSQNHQQHAPICLEPSVEEGKEECPKPVAAG
jgi:cytoskeletal protein RodZ